MANLLHDLRTVLRGALRLLARPVRASSDRGGLVVRPFRGYGTPRQVLLMGRVMRQPGAPQGSRRGSLPRDLLDTARRVFRHGVAGARLRVRFAGAEEEVESGQGGYFRVRLRPTEPPAAGRTWYPVELELIDPGRRRKAPEEPVRARGEVFIPPPTARRVVISDIDDTVMLTGVANKAAMLWRLFAQGAESRVAFAGVGALYRGLHEGDVAGSTGDDGNPLLYVSRGPWSIYDVLDRFFEIHAIPVGPILFLRDWGLRPWRPIPRRGEGHKEALIRDMLELYENLPFVLVGDSGQHDPETYAQVVHDHPGRVEAIYIRNVDPPDGSRVREIEALVEEVAAAGSTLLLAADSFAMAQHAFEHGLISEEVLGRVLAERAAEADEDDPPLQPRQEITAETPEETERAIENGEVEEALEEGGGDGGTPPNVEVEPRRSRTG